MFCVFNIKMNMIMKNKKYYKMNSKINSFFTVIIIVLIIVSAIFANSCRGTRTISETLPPEVMNYYHDSTDADISIEIHFVRGREHNHPLMVFWVEDTLGNYLQTLYIAESIGKGVFRYGATEEGHWKPGEIQRPSSLPYWAHKRGVKNEYGNYIPSPSSPMPDAVTGPTPKSNFILYSNISSENYADNIVLKMEINQSWDFNEYWTNAKFPGNEDYFVSCQPALVYQTIIDFSDSENVYIMKPVGHSHYDGSNGSLTEDLSTITTALDIVKELKVVVKDN